MAHLIEFLKNWPEKVANWPHLKIKVANKCTRKNAFFVLECKVYLTFLAIFVENRRHFGIFIFASTIIGQMATFFLIFFYFKNFKNK